jgi:TetR/AcrR family transcriptional regulator, transcriptional repressor for nem operon
LEWWKCAFPGILGSVPVKEFPDVLCIFPVSGNRHGVTGCVFVAINCGALNFIAMCKWKKLDYGNDCFHNRTMKIEAPSLHMKLSTPRGRPREFDMDEALDKAIPVFCSRGYHGTSISDLAEGMQLTVGSIYKAFKDKRAVFLAVLDRQSSQRSAELSQVLAGADSGRDKVQAALVFYAELSHGSRGREGCLVVSTAVELAALDVEIGMRAAEAMRARELLMNQLIRQGKSDGSIPLHIDSVATGRLLLCLLQGLRVVGKTGKTRKEMLAVVAAAMKALV